MKYLYTLIDPNEKHIPVDKWDTPEYPIDESDRIFKNVRGEIILPIHELFSDLLDEADVEKAKQLDYFAMNSKRAYNSDVIREHICKYLNYFEKFYDKNKEFLLILYHIKVMIDYVKTYSIDNLADDINRLIIRNFDLTRKVRWFVDHNYMMKLSSNNNRTPNLQFNDDHAKVLYEISLLSNMYIPLISHYMYIHGIKDSDNVHDIIFRLFDLCVVKYEEERGIYIYDKLYETETSVVNKSISIDKQLWEKNLIRGNNPTTHVYDAINEIILQILPKYTYDKHIINFNYYSNRLNFILNKKLQTQQLCNNRWLLIISLLYLG